MMAFLKGLSYHFPSWQKMTALTSHLSPQDTLYFIASFSSGGFDIDTPPLPQTPLTGHRVLGGEGREAVHTQAHKDVCVHLPLL